jgi:hypothetical protein
MRAGHGDARSRDRFLEVVLTGISIFNAWMRTLIHLRPFRAKLSFIHHPSHNFPAQEIDSAVRLLRNSSYSCYRSKASKLSPWSRR